MDKKKKKRSRKIIHEEIDKIEMFSSQEEWVDFLTTKGNNHRHYYHYTTINTLKAILASGHWKLKRADLSNDSNECPVYNTSFTTSSLSSMGMWGMYSKLSSTDDIGVRIDIPKKTFKGIFSKNATWYTRNSEGIFQPFAKATPQITDVAYWHFGKTKNSSLAIYKSYQLPGPALNFHFSKDQQLPPQFKNAIWRKEEEVRVFYDFSNFCNVHDSLYVKIKPEHFKNMKFRISPAISNYKNIPFLQSQDNEEDCLQFIVNEILEKKLDIEQFTLPTQYEKWQSNF